MKTFLFCHAVILGLSMAGAASAKQPPVEFLNSGKVLPTNAPFSEAVRVDRTLYLSGQIGIEPGTFKLVPGGLKEETRQTMENIKTTLAAHGYSLRDVVKCTVMLADISKWGEFNEVYKTFFGDRYPARSALGANGLALGAQVEIECIAVAGAGGS
ncbi:MAG TPA: Rid family detoxifying hydrolase [Lysobacter sp.]